jgi:hypothetical protein
LVNGDIKSLSGFTLPFVKSKNWVTYKTVTQKKKRIQFLKKDKMDET